jgi:hypothetical protein
MGSSTKTLLALGFITVRHHHEHGFFGGYLIINQLARPLEFHCTLPVKPSRAQSLLYGPTLDDFVCGEQIAKALVHKAKLKPALVVTDCTAVLAMENVADEPLVLVASNQTDGESTSFRRPSSNLVSLRSISASGLRCQTSHQSHVTVQLLEEIVSQLAPNFDVSEPFQRIAEALLEAHPSIKAAA